MNKKILLVIAFVTLFSNGFAQADKFWTAHNKRVEIVEFDKGVARLSFPTDYLLFDLNITTLRQALFSIVDATTAKKAIISLPNTNGELEQFEVYEASNFEADLQARFPEIRAFSGKGITDKYATLKLSISPQGIQTMIFRADKENEFIEPYSKDHTVYAVFSSQRERGKLSWSCSTEEAAAVEGIGAQLQYTNRSNTAELKTLRLAQSCNAEYSNYFGATNATQVGLVLAAFNATLTRCNGVYEKDLGLHLNLVDSSTNVIYYIPALDPYTTLGSWNTQLQNTLSTKLTGPSTTLAANNAAYDIGHMFGASGGGGNAGCIGCVCEDDTASTSDQNKGAGITSPGDGVPQGDSFDIDYVAHEVGHQLGGTHTFSMSNEGSGTNMEVGSGVTIMGYAGITNQDIAPHSIDIFHAVSISQIQTNLATKTCAITQPLTTNVAPIVDAGLDYKIPKSTPFALKGSATDENTDDVLTYCWEQYNNALGSQQDGNSVASITKVAGPNWRDWSQTTDPIRYMPTLSTILANQQTTAATGDDAINVEALSSVARTLTFRLTVRDNAPYINTPSEYNVGQTNFDDMIVTVVNTPGSFTVTSQNVDGIEYEGLSTQSILWNVAGTNLTPIVTAYVKISLSTDGGMTFPIVLAELAENDGEELVTIPNNIDSSDCRIKVEAVENIFFNVNTKAFTITTSLSSQAFNLKDFRLYPNPNNGNFTIKFSSLTNNDIQITVNDLRGRLIMNKTYANSGMFSENIQVNALQAGVYLVTIKDGDKQVVKKIVVE